VLAAAGVHVTLFLVTRKVMGTMAKSKDLLDKALPGRARSEHDSWWAGRQVAIRPDVPGGDFDPSDLVLIKDDEERMAVQASIERSVDEAKEMSPEELWPDWLWET
jgi:hypothetical protein